MAKVPRIDAGSDSDHIYVYYNFNGTATYNQSAADEAAFDKFFSSDVEPEPAQRWLLNE